MDKDAITCKQVQAFLSIILTILCNYGQLRLIGGGSCSIETTILRRMVVSIASDTLSGFLSHINLAGHRGGDEGGAVLFELLDPLADLGDEGIELSPNRVRIRSRVGAPP